MTTAQGKPPKQIDYDEPNSILSQSKSSATNNSKRKLESSMSMQRQSST